jgi:hypothetical protein
MHELFIKQCLDIIQKEAISSPVITLICNVINPYIYITIFVILVILFGILSNTIILILIWNRQSSFLVNEQKDD